MLSFPPAYKKHKQNSHKLHRETKPVNRENSEFLAIEFYPAEYAGQNCEFVTKAKSVTIENMVN